MPELPEVEAERRDLVRWLRKKTIVCAEIPATRVIRPDSAPKVEGALVGRTITAIDRTGKWLRFSLDDGSSLYGHLGMTGRWSKTKLAEPALPHERARLDTSAASIRYVDPRMFGRLMVRAAGQTLDAWEELGPDPLRDGIDPEQLAQSLSKRSRSIKETLLDQTVIAGVGNIHAVEALWRARLDPKRRARSLSKAEVSTLADAIQGSLRDGLARHEAGGGRYVDDPGAPNPYAIYGRSGEPCPRCAKPLRGFVQGGRSTVFCPVCQRLAGRKR